MAVILLEERISFQQEVEAFYDTDILHICRASPNTAYPTYSKQPAYPTLSEYEQLATFKYILLIGPLLGCHLFHKKREKLH